MIRLVMTALFLSSVWISANAQPAAKMVNEKLPVVAGRDEVAEQLLTCQQVDEMPALMDIKVTDPKVHDRDYDRLSTEQRAAAGRGIENGKLCRLGGYTGLFIHNPRDPSDPNLITCAQGETAEFYQSGSVRTCQLGYRQGEGGVPGTTVLTGDDDRGHECRWGHRVYFNKDGTVNMGWTNRVSGSSACP
jgi:hypothetical protein